MTKKFQSSILVCSLKCFFKKLIMWFCREFNSEQLPLELLLKMRSYSSGNLRIFGKMSGIFVSFSKNFLRFSKIGLYLTRAASRCPRRGIPVMLYKMFHKKTENDFDKYILEIYRINVIQGSNTFQGFSCRKVL